MVICVHVNLFYSQCEGCTIILLKTPMILRSELSEQSMIRQLFRDTQTGSTEKLLLCIKTHHDHDSWCKAESMWSCSHGTHHGASLFCSNAVMTFLAMNQFSGGSRQKNKLYTGHLFLKQPRIFIQPSHQPFDLEQKCINLCPSQTCPVQKSSCLLGGSWWISTVSLPMFASFNATYHIGHISLAHFGVAFGFIPVWTTKKSGRFASNSGEDDWREVGNHSTLGGGWIPVGKSILGVSSNTVEASEMPNNHLFGCPKTPKSND